MESLTVLKVVVTHFILHLDKFFSILDMMELVASIMYLVFIEIIQVHMRVIIK